MIDGLQHTEGDNECSVCEIDFADDEGGMLGYIGIIPVAFCPTCYSGICDMVGQLDGREWEGLTDEEFERCIALKNPMAIAEEVESKLKEKNEW